MHGFELKDKSYIAELNAFVMIYEHINTGAKLLHIDNEDTNKVFSVAFRTPPLNNTGVAHIIEHSVLCGSNKFPIKEPYKELQKSSLYTFINAMTDKDFTVYPVASVNEKDLLILSEVYIDAVFFPLLHKIDEIFYQEGWRFELKNKKDDLKINGIVYNEMINAFSNPDEILCSEMLKNLFPDTVYANNYAGLPASITSLTIKEFREYHQKYYHPSNSYFYIYGKIDINKIFQLIENNAFKHFSKRNIDSKIYSQPIFKYPIKNECFYSVLTKEEEIKNTWHSIGLMLDINSHPDQYLALKILTHLLFENSDAPVKKALLKSGICDDVRYFFDTDTLQPYIRVTITGSEQTDKEKFEKIFFKTLSNLCKHGIDKKLIESSLAINEFELREAYHPIYPKGIVYLLDILPQWIHDFDPISYLKYDNYLAILKHSLLKDYFESLIKKYFLQNNHYAIISLIPKESLDEQENDLQKQKLKKIKTTMNDIEIGKILLQNDKLLKRQKSTEPIEKLNLLPQLSLNDINRMSLDYSVVSENSSNNKLIFHKYEEFTNSIVYIKMYFDPIYVPKALLQYARALSYLLGKIHTKNYKSNELSNLINLNTGGIDFDFTVYENYEDIYNFRPYFTISTKSMFSQMESSVDLILEIINNSLFDETNQLKRLLLEHKSFIEMLLMNLGDMFAHLRLSSYYSPAGRYREHIDGIEYYFFLKDLLKNFDKNRNQILNNFYQAFVLLFNCNNCRISITASEHDLKKTQDYINEKMSDINHQNLDTQLYYFNPITENEAFILPGRLQFVAKGYLNNSIKYNGELEVLEQIIGRDYLWNKIRVIGGAYGSSFYIGVKGDIIAVSSSDPNLSETLSVYDGIASYLKKLKMSDKEFIKYILSAIRKHDLPKTPYEKSCISDHYLFSKRTKNDLQHDRDLILDTSLSNIKKYSPLLENVMNKNCYCIFGSKAKIEENTHLFNKIINVF